MDHGVSEIVEVQHAGLSVFSALGTVRISEDEPNCAIQTSLYVRE